MVGNQSGLTWGGKLSNEEHTAQWKLRKGGKQGGEGRDEKGGGGRTPRTSAVRKEPETWSIDGETKEPVTRGDTGNK